MSIECGECERDLRGPHATDCSRYRPEVCLSCGAVDMGDEESVCRKCGGTTQLQDRPAERLFLHGIKGAD